jgi:hypothetical protein
MFEFSELQSDKGISSLVLSQTAGQLFGLLFAALSTNKALSLAR